MNRKHTFFLLFLFLILDGRIIQSDRICSNGNARKRGPQGRRASGTNRIWGLDEPPYYLPCPLLPSALICCRCQSVLEIICQWMRSSGDVGILCSSTTIRAVHSVGPFVSFASPFGPADNTHSTDKLKDPCVHPNWTLPTARSRVRAVSYTHLRAHETG